MREKEFVPQKSADVYNFVYNTDIQFSGPMGKHDFSTLLFESFSLAMSQFADALKSNIFDSNRDWIFHMLLQGFRLRLERPHFITELVIGEGTFSPLFYQILHNIGTPFFTDKKWKGGFVPPTNLTVIPNQPYQLLGFQQFLHLFAGQRQCLLYKFCKTKPDRDITNHHCTTAPWLRATEEELCPFGQLWKTWGLINKTPKWP